MHRGASQLSQPGELPPAPAEALTALVPSSETTSSTVSAMLASPHSHTTSRACNRAHGTALGNAASSRCDRSGQPAVAGAARPFPSGRSGMPRPVIPRLLRSVIRNCPLIAIWLLINAESSDGDPFVMHSATCRAGLHATLARARMPMSTRICKHANEGPASSVRGQECPASVRRPPSGFAALQLSCDNCARRPG
jgi:hypothetical protein